MSDWTNHKFVLAWIKDNLSAYQFITPAAKQIQKVMEINPLETDDDIRAFGQAYENFLQLVERNPFTAQNKDGAQASIVVSDFYFFLYPTRQNLMIPIGLQIEMGVTNTKENAREFKERLAASVNGWKQQYEIFMRKKKKLPDLSQEDADYEQYMNKASSTFSYMIRQVLLLVMITICLGGNILLYTKQVYESYGELQLLSVYAVTVVSILYFLKSLQCMIREKKRNAYVKAWKDAKNNRDVEKISQKGFRSLEVLQEILQKIEDQKYQKEEKINVSEVSILSNKKEISLSDLEQKKVRNRLYTINNSHILAMLTVLLCFSMYAGNLMPQAVQNMKVEVSDKIDEWIVSPYFSVCSKEERIEAFESVNLEIQVLKGEMNTFSDIDMTQKLATYQKNDILTLLDTVITDDGTVICHFLDQKQKITGYVYASLVRVKEANAIIPQNMQILDKTGAKKETDKIENLFDGNLESSYGLEQGDIVQMSFADAVQIRNLYIMNKGVKSVRIKINGKESYLSTFSTDKDTGSYIIPMPEGKINLLELQIVSSMRTDPENTVSELLLCR